MPRAGVGGGFTAASARLIQMANDTSHDGGSAAPEPLRGLKYTVGDVVARGGMGAIHVTEDLHLHRTVALKRLISDAQAEAKQRFVQEARVLARLEHPNIVPVHDLGADKEGHAYYVMKFVHGLTLNDVIRALGDGNVQTLSRFPFAQLITILQKVCDGVAFAHSKGIIHRDLKPSNVMLGDFGEVLVMDWGLAKILSEGAGGSAGNNSATQPSTANARTQSTEAAAPEGAPASRVPMALSDSTQVLADKTVKIEPLQPVAAKPPTSGLTMDGAVMGTVDYMAPEQAHGKVAELDVRTDVFALGGLLYAMLTLKPPITGDTPEQALLHARRALVPPPGWHEKEGAKLIHLPGGRIPEALAAVAMKAMDADPVKRYQTVAEFQRDLAAWQAGFVTSAESAGTFKLLRLLVRRRKVEFSILSAAAAVIVGLAAVFVWQLMESEERAKESARHAKQLLAVVQSTPPQFFDTARRLLEDGRFNLALEQINQAVALAPDEPEYLLLKAHLLQSRLELAEARDAYAAVLQLVPDNASAKENQALCAELLPQLSLGRLPQNAMRKLTDALRRQGRGAEVGALMMHGMQREEPRHRDDVMRLRRQLGMMADVVYDPQSKGFRVSLAGQSVTNLAALSGNPIVTLDLTGNPDLTDLSPLRGLPLQMLDLTRTRVRDLSPLKGAPLRWLDLTSSPVEDLGPLKGLPLTTLNISFTRVRNLSALAGSSLTELRAGGSAVSDLSPLRGLPLEMLRLHRCVAVKDLSPLAELPQLTYLSLPTQELDYTPIEGLKNLRYISLGDPGPNWPSAVLFWQKLEF